MNEKCAQALIQVHGKTLTTTSLVIAELFDRPHYNVLQSLDKLSKEISELTFKATDYIDKNGDPRRALILTERQFLIAMPFIGGRKSLQGQIKLVDEFLRLRSIISNPERAKAIQEKRSAAKPMTDMLVFVREGFNKDTMPKHYQNEHRFCNRALNGKYEMIDESTLDAYDAKLLEAIRKRNTLLISRYPVQKDRKKPLDDFVAEYRAKNPRLIDGQLFTANGLTGDQNAVR